MAFNPVLAERVRKFLQENTDLGVEEKKMFGGLGFMVDGKMCVNVSGEKLMCRFDPNDQEEVASRKGYQLLGMKNRVYKGFCYVTEDGFKTPKDFAYWMNLCLTFNPKAKSSKKK